MKQKTIEKIMVAYNELVNTNSDISSRLLADKANTSLRNAQEFLRDLKTESDKSKSNKTVSDKSELIITESESDKSVSDKTESVSEQKINVETGEGYVQQLNLLYKEGIITKEEYIEDVIRSNRNYPNFLPKPFMKKFFEKIANNSTKY